MLSHYTAATNRKWTRTTVERYGKVEPVPDAWSLVGPDGALFAQIWLERNPKDPWFEKWVVLAFFNRRGYEQGFNGAYPTGPRRVKPPKGGLGQSREPRAGRRRPRAGRHRPRAMVRGPWFLVPDDRG